MILRSSLKGLMAKNNGRSVSARRLQTTMAVRTLNKRKCTGGGDNGGGDHMGEEVQKLHRVTILNKIYYTNYVDVDLLRGWMEDKWGKSYDIEFYKQNDKVWAFDIKTTYLGQDIFRFQTCEDYENYLSDICASINELGLAEELAYEIKRCTHSPYIVLGRWKKNVKIPLHPRAQ